MNAWVNKIHCNNAKEGISDPKCSLNINLYLKSNNCIKSREHGLTTLTSIFSQPYAIIDDIPITFILIWSIMRFTILYM